MIGNEEPSFQVAYPRFKHLTCWPNGDLGISLAINSEFIDSVDNLVSTKANSTNAYTKSEINNSNLGINKNIGLHAPLSVIDLGGVYRLAKSADNQIFNW